MGIMTTGWLHLNRRGLNGFFDLNEEDLRLTTLKPTITWTTLKSRKLIEKNAKVLKQIRTMLI